MRFQMPIHWLVALLMILAIAGCNRSPYMDELQGPERPSIVPPPVELRPERPGEPLTVAPPGPALAPASPAANPQSPGATAVAPGAWTAWKFDFGAPASAAEPGYLVVSGSKVYIDTGPALDYGWAAPVRDFDRNHPSSLLLDGCFGRDPAIFRADVPVPGNYQVKIYLGDAQFIREHTRITAEGVATIDDVTTGKGDFAERTLIVNVHDGTLDLEFRHVGGGTPDWVVNGVEVYPAAGDAPARPVVAPK